jgi:hypothetical protein
MVLACCWGSLVTHAATWKADGEIGMLGFGAEVDDSKNPMPVLVRVENHAKLASTSISRYFVQMTDGDNKPLRAVTADELVSERLQRLRKLLPQNINEIDAMMGEIQADYPQQKIINVYARLKHFMTQNRPTGWRTRFENWVSGTRFSSDEELKQAQVLIEEIGSISQNYFWPRDLAPNAVYTGVLFFEHAPVDPMHIFFEVDRQFIGTSMKLISSDSVKNKK